MAKRIQGDGDRIFNGFGRLVKEVKHHGFESTFRRLKEGELNNLDLPTGLEKFMVASARTVQGKLEDLEEIGSDLRDNWMLRVQDYFLKMVKVSGIPTREDYDKLKDKISELERVVAKDGRMGAQTIDGDVENLAEQAKSGKVKASAATAKRSRKRSTKRAGERKSKAAKKENSNEALAEESVNQTGSDQVDSSSEFVQLRSSIVKIADESNPEPPSTSAAQEGSDADSTVGGATNIAKP